MVLFAALAFVTRSLCIDQIGNTSFWSPNAAIVVALLTLQWRLSLLTALVCFCFNMALNTLTNYTLPESLMFSALNIVQGYVAAFLTRSLCGARTDLTRFRRLVTFAGIALSSSGLEAFLGDALIHKRFSQEALLDWLQWTLCDGLGLLLGVPAILLLVKSLGTASPRGAGRIERCMLLVLTVGLTLASFSAARLPLFLLLYPLLVTIAFRAGPAWVLASVLVMSILASAMTAHGYGPIAWLSPSGHLLRQDTMQPYLVSLFLVALPANSALGELERTAGRLQQTRSNLVRAATHDALTALMNRELFHSRLKTCLLAGPECVVVFVDLDRFKQVNDTFGHQAGDELLRQFASRLCLVARSADALVARFGGDEFALLVRNEPDPARIETLCSAISAASRAPYQLAAGRAYVTVSMGVASVRDGNAEELMRKADIALYAAKAAGRDGCRVFSEELDLAIQDRAELEAELRAALDGVGGLSLHYQIKVDRSGRARSVEALVRWQHPRLGAISPQRFIPVAEETGLIMPLGAWVFGEAVAFAKRWPQLVVAVNVSPVQLCHADFATEMLHTLDSSSVSHGRIEIEVTESALLEDLHLATQNLAKLRVAGLRVALDDFGTGYSSLRHLHRLTVDRVKIDQTFVRSLGEGAEPAAIVQAIIQLGHAMGIAVTAEGVETASQRDFLVAAGIDEMQGYLFARPMGEAALGVAFARLDGEGSGHDQVQPDLVLVKRDEPATWPGSSVRNELLTLARALE